MKKNIRRKKIAVLVVLVTILLLVKPIYNIKSVIAITADSENKKVLTLFKDKTRYNGVNEDGNPKEEPWAFNFIVTRQVNENTEYTINYNGQKQGSFQLKEIHFFNSGKYISSEYNAYGISKFTTPKDCDEIRLCLFGESCYFFEDNISILASNEKHKEVPRKINNVFNSIAEIKNTKYADMKLSKDAFVITPEMFNAVGDGITDDYRALKEMVDYLNKKENNDKKFVVLMGENKIYKLDRYIGDNSSPQADRLDIRFLDNLTFLGNGSTVLSKGDFTRAKEETPFGGHYRGDKKTISFGFTQCNNLIVKDLIRDSQGNKTTDAEFIAGEESNNTGIFFAGCTNVLIENIKSKYSLCDAITIGESDANKFGTWTKQAGMNIVVKDSDFSYASRNVVNIGCVQNLEFINCSFKFAGDSGNGKGYAPALGVDIEPAFSKKDGYEVQPNDIRFTNCTFEGNKKGAFAIVEPWILNTKFEKCKFLDTLDEKVYSMFIGGTGTEFIHCEFDLNYKITTVGIQPMIMKNCIITAKSKDLISPNIKQENTIIK